MISKIVRRAQSQPHLVAGAILILGVLTLNIYRAINQSITHDEALTFNAFVSEGWRFLLFTFDSNNHVLHSATMRLSTTLFGNSALSLRLPALFGGLFYMLAMERLSREFLRDKSTYFLTLSAAILSPFFLDYLVLARGYSLALAFLMVAILLASREIARPKAKDGIPLKTLVVISFMCAFSVAANLAFAFPCAALLLTMLLASLRRQASHAWSAQIASLVLPGAFLFLVLNPAIFNFTSSQAYFGADSWGQTLSSLLTATFDGLNTGANNSLLALILPALPWLSLFAIGAAGFKLLINRSEGIVNRQERLWLFVFVMLALTIVLQSLASVLFGALLPFERTGIYFLPLAILLLVLSIEINMSVSGTRWIARIGQVTLLLLAIVFLSNLRSDHFRGREYDSRAKEIYESLRTMDIQRSSEIGINWLLEPSLNYYRSFFGDSYMPRFTREAPNIEDQFFVLLPEYSSEDQGLISDYEIEIVYEEDFSGAVIGLR